MDEGLKQRVGDRYAGRARSVLGEAEDSGSCCGGGASCCGVVELEERAALERDMGCGSYCEAESGELPQLAADASLGCGNPVASATLSAGEIVLDRGSGGGIDVLLSARRVAPGGRAYGLDMTEEMLELARRNQAEAGVENAEFLKGEIEDVPLLDGQVDVAISNCVINLSTEKERVIGEAFRVLKPGGRFAVSDVVFLGEKNELPPGVARNVELWSGCVSGALERGEYEALLSEAGFEEVAVEVTHTCPPEQIAGLSGGDAEALRRSLRPVPLSGPANRRHSNRGATATTSSPGG